MLKSMQIKHFPLVLLLLFVSALPLHSQTDVFLINPGGKTLGQIFDLIEEQSDYTFFYNNDDVNADLELEIEIESAGLEEIMSEILANTSYEYRIRRKHIILTNSDVLFSRVKKKQVHDRNPASDRITPIHVSGVVLDKRSQLPMANVTVIIPGKKGGTITDSLGRYRISLPERSTNLAFLYVGYLTEYVEIGTKEEVNVEMIEEFIPIDEVIVFGYGSIRKRDVTAAIASIKGSEMKKILSQSALQGMKGQLSGVDITQTGGKPGQEAVISIRGRRSISADKPPLVVVDGIPLTNGAYFISDLNANDIESVEILKDAASSAIYGFRGANGVILITTRRGKPGETTVAYEGYYGITTPLALPDFMNAGEFSSMIREAWRYGWNGELRPDEQVFSTTELSALAEGVDTDWLDLVFNKGYRTNHNFSIVGGNDRTHFNISLGYFDEQGLISTMVYSRLSSRINLDHRVNDKLKIGTSLSIVNSHQDVGSDPMLIETYANSPLGKPFTPSGEINFFPVDDGRRTNPLAEQVEGANIHETEVTRIFAPVYIEFNPFKGLEYRVNFGPDIRFSKYGEFVGQWTNQNLGVEGSNDVVFSNSTWRAYTFDNILTYRRKVGEKHDITFTGVSSLQSERYEFLRLSGSNVPFDHGQYYILDQASLHDIPETDYYLKRIASIMGRAIYSFSDRYIFQVTVRHDGASPLTEDMRWGTFPGVSVGWRISEESFMQGFSGLGDLKFRASYGTVGSAAVDPYGTLGRLGVGYYTLGESYNLNYLLVNLPAESLGWERSTTFNLGLDFSICRNRINGALDVYSTRNTDLILARALPTTSGYPYSLENIGETLNRGIEFNVSAAILRNTEGFSWNMDMNLSHNLGKIIDLGGAPNIQDTDGNWFFVGEEIDIYYDYRKIGIYQANEADLAASREKKVPGEIKLYDRDGDGIITDKDRVVFNREPKLYGGFLNNFSYRNFDFSVFLYFRVGHVIKSEFNRSQSSLKGITNNLDVDYWVPPAYDDNGIMVDPGNPTNEYPRPNAFLEYALNGESLQYFDGSYLKIRNVNLGYSFPERFTSKLRISQLRLFLTGEDLLFFSEMSLFDPENGTAHINDRDAPSTRSFLAGVNIVF